MLNTIQLCSGSRKWTLSISLISTLLRLYRAKVVTSARTMIHKVALAEGLLKVLTRLVLESTVAVHSLLLSMLRAGTGTFCRLVAVSIVLVAKHEVAGVKFTTLSRLHQLVSFICSLLLLVLSDHIELRLVVIESRLSTSHLILLLLSQKRINLRGWSLSNLFMVRDEGLVTASMLLRDL